MSTSNCATKIAQNILNDACVSYGSGIKRKAWIFRHDDIDKALTVEDGRVISTIALKSGAKAFQLISPKNLTPHEGVNIASQETTIGIKFTKTAPITLLHNTKENANNVEAIMSERHVIVLETLKSRETAASGEIKATTDGFIIIGWETGCIGGNMVWNPYADDNNGGWIGDATETDAVKSQIFVDAGGYAATIAMLEALENAG